MTLTPTEVYYILGALISTAVMLLLTILLFEIIQDKTEYGGETDAG